MPLRLAKHAMCATGVARNEGWTELARSSGEKQPCAHSRAPGEAWPSGTAGQSADALVQGAA